VGQPVAVADRPGGGEVDGRAGGRGGEGGGRGVGREGAAEGLRWRVWGQRRVGRELDGGGRGVHDGVGREEGAWGGARRRREGREVDGGGPQPPMEWGGSGVGRNGEMARAGQRLSYFAACLPSVGPIRHSATF